MINVTVPRCRPWWHPWQRIGSLLLLLICSSAAAKLKPEPHKEKQSADCIYEGEFTRLEPIRIGGHDVRPVAIGIGTLRVLNLVSSNNPICSAQNEFEVIFSTGKGDEGGCKIPSGVHTRYEVALNMLFDGSFSPAGCLTWLRELRPATEVKADDQGHSHEE
jgi:hypothetical protein